MSTEHCKKCESNKPCGKAHLYVIQFKGKISNKYKIKSRKGYLYVGSTGKSVEQRFEDNFIKDQDGKWKYNTKNVKNIREYFNGFKPELYYGINPITLPRKKRKEYLEKKEKELADSLRKEGWRAGGPSKKKKKPKVKIEPQQ